MQVMPCMLLGATLLGPTARADGPSADDDSSSLPEIVVSAQKYTESLQNTDISISAVTGTQLQQMGAQSLADYTQFTPGVAFSVQPAGARNGVNITIDGIANSRIYNANTDTTAALTTAMYIDDVYIAPVDPSIYDLQRVEVLKGPQGTLFGQAAMGGAVRFITNPVDANNFHAAGDMTLSTYDEGGQTQSADGMLNLPLITGVLAARVSVSSTNDGGWITFRTYNLGTGLAPTSGPGVIPDYNSSKSRAARLSLQYTPTDNLTITPMIFWQDHEQNGEDAINAELGTNSDIREGYFPETREEDFYVGAVTVHYNLPQINITSVTGYSQRHYDGAQDTTAYMADVEGTNSDGAIPATNSLVTDNTSNMLTQELRAESNRSLVNWLQFTVGESYTKEIMNASFNWDMHNWNAAADGAGTVPSGYFTLTYDRTKYTDMSEYADATIFLFDDRLSFGAGIRHADQKGYYTGEGLGQTLPATFTQQVPLSDEQSNSIPRYHVAYKVSDNHLIYADLAKGFRLGGVGQNTTDIIPACVQTLDEIGMPNYNGTYKSDSITNYTVGTKNSWLGNHLETNVDAFYIRWDDLQSQLNLNVLNEACDLSITANIGNATSKGVDTEVRSMFGPVELSATAAYTDAHRGVPPPGVTAFTAGEPFGGVPMFTGSLSGQYSWPILKGDAVGFVRADLTARSWMLSPDFTSPTDPYQIMHSYTRLNIRFGANWRSFGVTLFVDNLTNKIAEMGGGEAFGEATVDRVLVMPPRTTGIKIDAQF